MVNLNLVLLAIVFAVVLPKLITSAMDKLIQRRNKKLTSGKMKS
jgi:hypothetical protein